jgi:TetR/AcrR family transcriptional regulator
MRHPEADHWVSRAGGTRVAPRGLYAARLAQECGCSAGTSIPSGTYNAPVPIAVVRSHDRILNKALELFSRKGYDATSVREICEAAGITKPTLYHFYGSKEGVYRALVNGSLDSFRAQLLARIEEPGPVRDRLRSVARSYFEIARGNRELVRFMLALTHNPSSSAPAADIPRFYEEVVALVARVVEEGVARGELRPGATEPRMLALMGALGESLVGQLVVGRPELTAELADALVDTILDGWVAATPPANGNGRS